MIPSHHLVNFALNIIERVLPFLPRMVGVSTYAAVVVLQLATVVNDLRKEMNDIGRLDADKGSQISKTTKKSS